MSVGREGTMRTSRGFHYVLPVIFLYALFLFGCGGGDEYKETGPPIIIPQACSQCHDIDILDTHFESITEVAIRGYLLNSELSWAPEGMGYILQTNENACSSSCHNYHEGDASHRQWSYSGHADFNSEAFDHSFSNGACLRCHSGMGFASYVDIHNALYPDWAAPTEELYAYYITCNACHDSIHYPTVENERLRKVGTVILTSGSSSTYVRDATLDVGNSASCFVCHEGRESGGSLFKAMVSKGVNPYDGSDDTMTDRSFVNIHYLPAGAMLFSLKGYEFRGKTYSDGNTFHQDPSCTGCHMAESGCDNLGGHTFRVSHSGIENVTACQGCHPDLTDFETFRLYDRDMDGDGRAGTIKEEIEGLKALIIEELEKADIYYNDHQYPYFFTVESPQIFPNRVTTWKESQLEAAFNLQYVNKEPGAYIHNFRYAVQLLRDSYEKLTGSVLPGVRPSTTDDRPAKDYSSL
jgi:hypothetical protein